MKISKWVIAAFSVSASLAQTETDHYAYQQNGWIGLHGVGTVGIHNVRPDGQSGPVTRRCSGSVQHKIPLRPWDCTTPW